MPILPSRLLAAGLLTACLSAACGDDPVPAADGAAASGNDAATAAGADSGRTEGDAGNEPGSGAPGLDAHVPDTHDAAKNYQQAGSLFARAHALYPNARTLRGQGMAAFELRRYEESVGFLEAALSTRDRALEGQLRTDTEALLARAELRRTRRGRADAC